MSAEVLCRAAKEIRRDQDVEQMLGHINGREFAAWLATADLLDEAAEMHDETPCPAADAALTVARAYLGELA